MSAVRPPPAEFSCGFSCPGALPKLFGLFLVRSVVRQQASSGSKAGTLLLDMCPGGLLGVLNPKGFKGVTRIVPRTLSDVWSGLGYPKLLSTQAASYVGPRKALLTPDL